MKRLQTPRCFLLPVSIGDEEALLSLYTSAQAREFLGGALSAPRAREKIAQVLSGQDEVFAVRLKQNGAFLGLVYLNPYCGTPFCEISYEFLPEFWGQGYACEALDECLRYCQEERRETQVVAETQQKNAASRRLLEKLGFAQSQELVRFGERQIVYHKKLNP
ncbi:GNAT family N-acetyltransferase [Christensenellaceae bacterium 44-20]